MMTTFGNVNLTNNKWPAHYTKVYKHASENPTIKAILLYFIPRLICVTNSPFWTDLMFMSSLLIFFPLIIQVLLNVIQVLNTASFGWVVG